MKSSIQTSFLLLLIVLLSSSQVQANIYTGLLAHYTFEGTVEDLKGNPQAQSLSGVYKYDKDRFNAPIRALQLQNTQDSLQIPTSILNGQQDYTISLWFKAQINSPTQTLFSFKTQDKFEHLMGTKLRASSYTSDLDQNFLSNIGTWKQLILTKNSQEQKYTLYLNGQEFQSFQPSSQEFDNSLINAEQFYIGNLPLESGLSDQYQFKGSISDLRLYNRTFTSQDAYTLYREELAGTQNYYCLKQLEKLFPNTITQTFTLEYNSIEEAYYHNYNIKLNQFVYNYECFKSQLMIGSNLIYHEIHDNEISIAFPFQNATQLGCIQASPTEQQCNFQLHIYFSGYLQHTKTFTSILTTPNPDNITENASQKVLENSDYPVGIFTEDDQIKFCTDITCTEYYEPTNIVRNTPIIIEYKTNNPEYVDFYPKHVDLTLNKYSVAIDNKAEIDTQNETGRIIYQFKPPYAGQHILLKVEVFWHENPSRRRLKQFDDKDEFLKQVFNGSQLLSFVICYIVIALLTVII